MKGLCIGFLIGVIGAASALPAVAAQGKVNVLHSFGGGTDGASPQAGLIAVNGTLYGTTSGGGTGTGCSGGCGTVFALDPTTGAETVLYSFCDQQNCVDGERPFGGLTAVGSTLYGTTNFGGAYGYGTVFALDPTSGAETVLHSFGSGADGATPFAALIDVNGTLYGTTQSGGADGSGTAFALNPGTGAETVLYSFCSQKNCGDGAEPLGGVIDVNGMLYGTTSTGGGSGDGAVFALNPNTGAENIIYSFCSVQHCKDGRFPEAGLLSVNGTLYGTTAWGGKYGSCAYGTGCGSVFALDPNSGAETVLYSFCSRNDCGDGSEPAASLISVKGMLYGTTIYGGDKACGQQYRQLRCGTVFSLDPTSGAETVLYSLCHQKNCADGEIPWGSLVGVSGTLYGTTTEGGTNGYGTVFAIRVP
jgi:uncharacterized repeat protein (TIGR03803 family)